MRVFVTGATGFVGSAVVKELLGAGHHVLGLARSDAGAAALAASGAEVLRGDVEDIASLKAGAANADGVIHTAFIHDFARFKECCEADRHAITALGDALAGSARPLIVTSAIGLLPAGRLSTEEAAPVPGGTPRIATEEAATALAARGVNVAILRLPPSVHDAGDHGFVPILINIAREKGVAAYPGEGQNLWPAVQRADAARLYRLALEQTARRNDGLPTRYHAVAEQGIAFKEIAGAIGKRLGLPVVAKAGAEAAAHFTWFAHFAGMDVPASSAVTRAALGWQPTGIGLLEDMERNYFGS